MKRRILPIIIAAGLVVLLSAGIVSASQKVFPDVQVGHWAEKDLAEMKAKGYVAGYADGFRPNEKLSREQVVAMLLRVVGLSGTKAQQSLEQHIGSNPIPWHKNVSPWAKEAVAVAWEKGIIPEADLKNFRPKDPAKRYEIAVFAVRAMGLTQAAQAKDGSGIALSDVSAIPAAYRGYVEVALEQKIFTGYADNTFRPNDVLTRLHFASILARIDSLQNTPLANVVKGEVRVGPDISRTMSVKDSSGAETVFVLSPGAFIYDGRNTVVEQLPPSALMPGHKVELVLDGDGLVVYAEIISELDEPAPPSGNQVKGVIAFTPDSSGSSLTIIHGGDQDTYPVKLGASVKINGATAKFSGLEGGQQVTLTLLDNLITAIDARDSKLEVKGSIEDIRSGSITIETEDGLGYQFTITGDTKIKVEGKAGDLEDLTLGQQAEVSANNLTALEIDVRTTTGIVEGIISELTFSPKWTITVETAEGSESTYSVDVKCDVERDGRNVTFADLVVGDEVELRVKNNLVTDIEAEPREDEAEGIVKKITIEKKTYITIEDEDGDDFTYEIPPGVRIRKDGKSIDLQEVKAGDYVELDLEGNRVTRMVVEGRKVLEYFTGEIEDINGRTDTIIITTDDDETIIVEVYRDTMIVKFGKEIDLDDLEEGDVITVTGEMDGSIVEASGIMVISASE